MVTEVINILLEDYDGHAIISDWGIKEKGTLITDVVIALDQSSPQPHKHSSNCLLSFVLI